MEKVLNDVPTLDVLYGEYESNNEFNVSSDSNSNITEAWAETILNIMTCELNNYYCVL